MMRIALAFLLLLVGWAAADDAIRRAESLREGDSLVIEFKSRGCFHGEDHVFEIRNGIAELRETRRTSFLNGAKPGSTTLLSAQDLSALDRYFEYLRSDGGGSCTTEHEIDLTWRFSDRAKEVETFVDGRCAAPDGPNELSVWRLLVKRF